MSSRPSPLARLLLRARPLGDRRDDVEADLYELFDSRVASHGLRHARRRFLVDVVSLWIPRRPRRTNQVPRLAARSSFLASVAGDLKFALRVFRRHAGATFVALAGLAIALGVCTAVFSLANAYMFRSVGVSDPQSAIEVVHVVGPRASALDGWPYADYLQMRNASLPARLEASAAAPVTWSTAPGSEKGAATVAARFVTGSFVQTFGGRATIGRLPGPDDDSIGAPAVAAIHHAFWQTRLGGDPSVVGRTVYVNGAPVTLIGVFDRRYTGPFEPNDLPAVVMPLASAAAIAPFAGPFTASSQAPVDVAGRVEPGSSVAQVEAAIRTIGSANGWIQTPNGTTAALDVRVRPAGGTLTAQHYALLAIVLTIVGLVLLLAATNIANLLLAGATTRQQEIGTRLALGASRSRIVRQLVTESVLLGAMAGAAGLLLSFWITPLIGVPPGIDLSPDPLVYLFVALVSVTAGVMSGLAPARFGARGDVMAAIRGGTLQAGEAPRSGRLRGVFLGVQATASFLLLILTALFGRALLESSRLPIGFDPDRVMAVSASAPRSGSHVPAGQFWDIALSRLRAIPGVDRVALVEHPPFDNAFHPLGTTWNGRRYPLLENRTSATYFETIGFRVLEGRVYTADEVVSHAPVAVITSKLARDVWPNGDAIGASLGRIQPGYLDDVRVIGIVSDAAPTIAPPNYSGAPTIFRPIADLEVARAVIKLADSNAPARAIQDALAPIDPDRKPRVGSVRDGIERQLEGPRTFAMVAGALGGLALTLAVIGMAGVTAFVVGQRRREIGIRLALGARRSDVVRTVFVAAFRPTAIGLATGVGLALLATPIIRPALNAGVSARDPLAYAGAIAILTIAAGMGVWMPARRAADVDPVVVLKNS